jgi:ribonuclease HIII
VRVICVPPDKLDAFEQALVDRAGQHQDEPGEHERFRIAMGRWDVVAYDSGKVTISDEDLMPVVEDVLDEVLEPAEETVIGSDEAGKGEWLGPLVVAAAAVDPDGRAGLVAHGIMDSKELSRDRVLEAADAVEDQLEHTSVVLVSPPRFNDLYEEFQGEGKSLNDLVAWAHARALGDLIDELGEDVSARVVVDEFDRVTTRARTSRALDIDRFPVEQRHQAEDEIAVAAASVLAKAARERWIDGFEERESVSVRSFSMAAAREHDKRDAFAKTSWLD